MTEAVAQAQATTFERVAHWAAHAPSRLAVADRRSRVSFAELHAYAVRFTRTFEAAGMARGQRVAIAQIGFAVELLAMLACENLGAVPVSFDVGEPDDAQALFAHVDWVLSSEPMALPARLRHMVLDQEFVTRSATVDAGAAPACVALAPGEARRLLRTSGSTGRPHWMLLSRAAEEARLRIHEQSRRFGAGATFMGAPFFVNAGLLHALACLRQGSPVARGTLAELAGVPISTFWGLPLHLERFLAELANAPPLAQPVDLRLVGSFVSTHLRERALRALRGSIANPYGTNEVGIVCDSIDDAGEGDVLPGIEVRILDAAGNPVPAGQGGTIAVRAPGAVARYEDDAQASAQVFLDGWFISGDHGALVAPGRLRVEGRHDDLVAVGGRKLPARQIEDRIRALEGVADVAACALRSDASGAGLALAIVARPGTPQAAIARDLPAALDPELAHKVRFQFMPALPRLVNGKVDRVALAQGFAQAPA